MITLQLKRSLKQGHELLEVASVLVAGDQVLQLVGVDDNVKPVPLVNPELSVVATGEADFLQVLCCWPSRCHPRHPDTPSSGRGCWPVWRNWRCCCRAAVLLHIASVKVPVSYLSNISAIGFSSAPPIFFVVLAPPFEVLTSFKFSFWGVNFSFGSQLPFWEF